MGFELEREVNDHFTPFYGYVADEILGEMGSREGRVLEIGPYGPGVSVALAQKCPGMSFVCGDSYPEALAYQGEKIGVAGLADRIEVRPLDMLELPFADECFELVLFRGGLFFWEEQEKILREMDRVLSHLGLGVHGGGFGARAPNAVIEKHLPRARELNDALGKKRLGHRDVEKFADAAGLSRRAYIMHRHGLWLFWRKREEGYRKMDFSSGGDS
ncbi:MAG: class I SAM-dependent methyltransferase [bacterium]|nr:class I SAM-dependent methyltransferase [bacterium]